MLEIDPKPSPFITLHQRYFMRLLALIALACLTCGCIQNNGYDFEPSCSEIEEQKGQDECYYSSAIRHRDVNVCARISEKELRENCIAQVAEKLENPSLCGKIPEGQARINCISYSNRGKKDRSLCEGMKDLRQQLQCFAEMGGKLTTVACNNLPDEKEKETCFWNVGINDKDRTACAKMSAEDTKNHCLAIAEDNQTLCALIQEPGQKSGCYAYFGLKTPTDEKTCGSIQNENTRKTCLAITKADPGLCMEIPGVDGHACIMRVSQTSGNYSYCEMIQTQSGKENCYLEYNAVTGDQAICEKINDKTQNLACYEKSAIKKKDLKICNKIVSLESADWCLMDFGTELSDPNACGNISDKTLQSKADSDSCYFAVAKALKEPRYCKNIDDQEEKIECEEKAKMPQ